MDKLSFYFSPLEKYPLELKLFKKKKPDWEILIGKKKKKKKNEFFFFTPPKIFYVFKV